MGVRATRANSSSGKKELNKEDRDEIATKTPCASHAPEDKVAESIQNTENDVISQIQIRTEYILD